ncbi:pentapeptide repeat-containing protein [Rothia mucilaginosa]|uniref:pentapeptide repeat-containing protein n=1 Tax=Rothia mucilaginosa TaxID=43675 RepID=UPI003A87636E
MPSNNASSVPESPVIPKAQENPWYIRHFIKLLIGFGLGGGAVAILLPWMLWFFCGMSSGSSDQLRLHLLYVTGGIIAVLTLLQTNWKNQGDRLKIDADIKKNEQDAEKNERDHIRQVHAERRSRYTKAVEQLADEKATVRLGGIYTLVGLVDEWLADESLQEESDRLKEGQVIVNSLCSYIRSPFTLALKAEMFESDSEPDNYEGDFSKDQAAFREEQDVRRTVFVEMSKRSSDVILDEDGKLIEIIPGTWSDFDVNFSRAPIFYPLNAITIEKGNFSSAQFYSNADFSKVTFTRTADFRAAAFGQTVNFSWATFAHNADFRWVDFTHNANFSWAAFTHNADFRWAAFTHNADFRWTTFTYYANFRWVIFTHNADFSETTFVQDADFGEVTFTQNTDFRLAVFAQDASFSETTFGQTANFGSATFTHAAYFWRAVFTQDADFSWAVFVQDADFNEATFSTSSPKFVETFETSGLTFRARFATLPENREAHNFMVSEHSQPILLGEVELKDMKYYIPVGTILFDPTSLDDETQDYITSEPAKPLDNSDEVEENKTN